MPERLTLSPPPTQPRRPLAATPPRRNLLAGWAVTSALSLGGWVITETLGGLIFLACGVRLWHYHITPVLWEIASPVGWLLVFLVAGVNVFCYLLCEHRLGVRGGRRWLYRALFLMVAGPVNEVLFNDLIWVVFGTPVYLYTVLPTFAGSGSLLSPLYYLTLLLGLWLEEWVPASLAARAKAEGGRRKAERGIPPSAIRSEGAGAA
jgi:hypothetical protein